LASWRSMMKIEETGSGSISQRHGSADPDPHQNVMDPQHWFWQRACGKLAALHCTVRQLMENLLATGGQSHTIFTWVAARCMLIVPSWPPVTYNMNKINVNLRAIGRNASTICMRLVAARVQFVCDWRPPWYDLFATGHQTHIISPLLPLRLCPRHLPPTLILALWLCFLCVGNDWIPICLQIRVR
jgi:hypothetical protein